MSMLEPGLPGLAFRLEFDSTELSHVSGDLLRSRATGPVAKLRLAAYKLCFRNRFSTFKESWVCFFGYFRRLLRPKALECLS